MDDMSSVLGANLRERRKAAGFDSQEALAQKVGCSWLTISRYERGKSPPSIEMLYRLADALGCKVSDLLPSTEAA